MTDEQMSPGEALQVVDNVLKQVSTNRDGHAKILEAMNVLNAAVGAPNRAARRAAAQKPRT